MIYKNISKSKLSLLATETIETNDQSTKQEVLNETLLKIILRIIASEVAFILIDNKNILLLQFISIPSQLSTLKSLIELSISN